ncbi:hypothetical protein H0B56_12860 [Haloechinothrix sp. YIM 98757]|uniref:Uncharacterized protein n=1 Tax=Haloechinothrix aidingensis TaxID=2752311 RepID=A0A838AB18_9PSEU|nr:hypothetical protein [Haloechinothrix aidingensis]MBA0126433.1 hypothetical protein [Haloechinothrix aidingensis]
MTEDEEELVFLRHQLDESVEALNRLASEVDSELYGETTMRNDAQNKAMTGRTKDLCPHCGGGSVICKPRPDKGPEAYYCNAKGLVREQLVYPTKNPADQAVEEDEDFLAAQQATADATEALKAIEQALNDARSEVHGLRLKTQRHTGDGYIDGTVRANRETKKATKELHEAEERLEQLMIQRDRAQEAKVRANTAEKVAMNQARMKNGLSVRPGDPLTTNARRTYVPHILYGG